MNNIQGSRETSFIPWCNAEEPLVQIETAFARAFLAGMTQNCKSINALLDAHSKRQLSCL